LFVSEKYGVCVHEVKTNPMVLMVLFCLSGEEVQCVSVGGDDGSHGPNGSVLLIRLRRTVSVCMR